ncbi:hypothetical protein INR49_015184 [Caranx melampygus]|nr:hypothetical protein INR49_015184 [Caranx melampygus]
MSQGWFICDKVIFDASSRLQDRLELSGHADILLFLTHDALNGGGQATGVPGEDEGIAVFAAAIFFQGAAGIGDGVVVVAEGTTQKKKKKKKKKNLYYQHTGGWIMWPCIHYQMIS